MSYVEPRFKRNEVNRAGEILVSSTPHMNDWVWAYEVLTNWRACHSYPMNTFQATLRKKLKTIDTEALVAQRLKRAPSVLAKLERFKTMNLSQMQDIGGLRAVVNSVKKVVELEKSYLESSFHHTLSPPKDYIQNPKPDGYRGIHLVYRYENDRAPKYNGLLLELQLRSRLQHAWATAVETMGTFLGQALKSGQGERHWREFFEIASAALAHVEKTAPVPGYEGLRKEEVMLRLAESERTLNVLVKLRGFSIAADKITAEKGAGSYHLVVLDSSSRSVSIKPFPVSQLEQASIEYAKIEERTRNGEKIDAVLVSAGPIDALKKAYPNFFLDTHAFVVVIERLIEKVNI